VILGAIKSRGGKKVKNARPRRAKVKPSNPKRHSFRTFSGRDAAKPAKTENKGCGGRKKIQDHSGKPSRNKPTLGPPYQSGKKKWWKKNSGRG